MPQQRLCYDLPISGNLPPARYKGARDTYASSGEDMQTLLGHNALFQGCTTLLTSHTITRGHTRAAQKPSDQEY